MFRFPGIGRDVFSTLGRDDRSLLQVGAGKIAVSRATEISDAAVAGLATRLDAIKDIATQTRLSQVPIPILFYGGLLSTGADPLAPPAETGVGFINAIQLPSNGSNSIPSFFGVELVRIGYGLNPNQAYPTGAGRANPE